MIRITQIKCSAPDLGQLRTKISSAAGCRTDELWDFTILRESLDARKKPELVFVYDAAFRVKGISAEAEERYIKKHRIKNASVYNEQEYVFSYRAPDTFTRPLIVGMGPAGLFCALALAQAGFKPIVIERGRRVEERSADVEEFWRSKRLNTESNVSFGEGGAGTFSDGKLNTLIKGSTEIHRHVLKTFVSYGADPDILYSYKPHIGTDVLRSVIVNIRTELIKLGADIRFETKLTGIVINEGRVTAAKVMHDGCEQCIDTDCICLAIGHSARDTFKMLKSTGISMEKKPFAVGVRVAHPQQMIDISQLVSGSPYGPAPYKLTYKTASGRGVYSFCMCPGGYVVNASSEEGGLCVNGMSYRDRAGRYANSAIVVTVTAEDFPGEDVLAGVRFQQEIERRAYEAGGGRIPFQTYGDLLRGRISELPDDIGDCVRGECAGADLKEVLPPQVIEAIKEAMPDFGRRIHGFDDAQARLFAAETRTSSPVRIVRDEAGMSCVKGLFPCGEGAGYAGGITSAAIDGIKTAEKIAEQINKAQRE